MFSSEFPKFKNVIMKKAIAINNFVSIATIYIPMETLNHVPSIMVCNQQKKRFFL
jgi:hypothetical protein